MVKVGFTRDHGDAVLVSVRVGVSGNARQLPE